MAARVYLDDELVAEKVVLVKANREGVAVKDDNGATRIIEGVYVAEVNLTGGFIHLRVSLRGDRDP